MIRVVVLGQTAIASDEFLLDDLPGSSGRLDVLVRCVRASLLVSHGVRRDVVVYLVLMGGPRAPRVVRVDGAAAKFIRPDERALATLLKKVLATTADTDAQGFVEVKPGVAIAKGALDVVLADVKNAAMFLLEEGAPDLRDLRAENLRAPEMAIFLGDHRGFDPKTRVHLEARGARAFSVGPTSLHSDDAIAVLLNEIDRAAALAPDLVRA